MVIIEHLLPNSFVNEVVSKVKHLSQCTQDQRVDIIINVDFISVVLHRKDAVHWDPHCIAQVIYLSVKQWELMCVSVLIY